MKIKYFEYIAVYLSVFLVCVFVGIIGRLVLLEKNADKYQFSNFCIVSSTIQIPNHFMQDLKKLAYFQVNL
jgi:hypothetical protein